MPIWVRDLKPNFRRLQQRPNFRKLQEKVNSLSIYFATLGIYEFPHNNILGSLKVTLYFANYVVLLPAIQTLYKRL
jgi:hypothetical protein